MQTINEVLERILLEDPAFMHLAKGIEVEAGQYWLSQPGDAAPPLSDRIEQAVLAQLRLDQELTTLDFDRMLCDRMPGMLTPDRRILMACLQSYATEDAASGYWILRQEDLPEARERDCAETERMLANIGERLGFQVPASRPVQWLENNASAAYRFEVSEMAFMGRALSIPQEPGQVEDILVVPGGRASLVAAKSRRNRWLKKWLESGVRVLKFRHVRRLYAETTLTSENLRDRIGIDPAGRHDPQMPLL
jgi:hypothetical protein